CRGQAAIRLRLPQSQRKGPLRLRRIVPRLISILPLSPGGEGRGEGVARASNSPRSLRTELRLLLLPRSPHPTLSPRGEREFHVWQPLPRPAKRGPLWTPGGGADAQNDVHRQGG